jgi:Flp pilus assembly protein CpaB
MKRIALFFVVGFVLASLVVGLLGWFAIQRKRDSVATGWAPVPVLVASRDVKEGEKLSAADLSETTLPEQFVTDSAVRAADRDLVIGRAVPRPLQRGDVIFYPIFARTTAAADACGIKIRPAVQAAEDEAKARAFESFTAAQPKSRPALSGGAEALPAGASDVEVVVITRDVEEGAVLEASALATRRLPRDLVTPSLVTGAHLKEVAGTRIVVAVQEGDRLMWQMLDDSKSPQRAISCVMQIATARSAARARVIKAEAPQAIAQAAEATP